MIRRATVCDHPWIVQLASEVYRELGDYGAILPGWLEHPGVLSYLVGKERERAGFILLGFYVPRDAPRGSFAADLLAIAVEPRYQQQGVGKGLLQHAIELAELAAGANYVPEMRLTVADTNLAGQRLFRSQGFSVLDAQHGSYDGGQRAIRMHRALGRRQAAQRRHA